MYTVLELLKDKNFCLEKFYKTNESELENFKDGNFDNLERFYQNREGILNIIKKIDELIERQSEEPNDETTLDMKMKSKISQEFELKNILVNKIVEQDLQILSAIEVAKSNIIKELTQVRTTKKALGSYKSGKPENVFDEEA